MVIAGDRLRMTSCGRAALAAALTVLAVCGGGAPGASNRPAFPVTVRDAMGSKVTVRSEPQRIVSLAPAMTEVLFALGLEKRIVGVTEYCNYPRQAKSKPKIGGIVNPSVERILAQKPDLVIGMRLNPKPVLRSLAKAGVPTFAAEPRSVKDVMGTITTVGALTGTRDAARALVSRMDARLREVEKKMRGAPRPTVALLYSEAPLWVAGGGTFPDHVIRLAGGRNAAEEVHGYKQYSVEALLARNPDVILLTSMEGGDNAGRVRDFMRRPSMRGLSAVKRNRVYMIDADLVDRAGPRIVDGVAEVADKLHPGVSAISAAAETLAKRGS
jgi:iron complex transport system substrate-binding protein